MAQTKDVKDLLINLKWPLIKSISLREIFKQFFQPNSSPLQPIQTAHTLLGTQQFKSMWPVQGKVLCSLPNWKINIYGT